MQQTKDRTTQANVLCRVEDAERKPSKKIARREKPSHGAHAEAGAVVEKVGNVLELRHVVDRVATVLLQEREDVLVLGARVRRV